MASSLRLKSIPYSVSEDVCSYWNVRVFVWRSLTPRSHLLEFYEILQPTWLVSSLFMRRTCHSPEHERPSPLTGVCRYGWVHTCDHSHSLTHTHTQKYICPHSNAHTHTHTQTHKYPNIRMHTHTHSRINTHTHTHTHTHTLTAYIRHTCGRTSFPTITRLTPLTEWLLFTCLSSIRLLSLTIRVDYRDALIDECQNKRIIRKIRRLHVVKWT